MNEQSFLPAILDAPDDDSPRLVFADFLDEHGQCDRAEFIRVGCRIAELEELCSCDNYEPGPVCWECCEKSALHRREGKLLESWSKDNEGEPLHNGDHFHEWFGDAIRWFGRENMTPRRGFIHSVTCSAEDWLRHGDAISAPVPLPKVILASWQTVQEVTLTTRPSIEELEENGGIYACLRGMPETAIVWHGDDLGEKLLRRRWDRVKDWHLPQYGGCILRGAYRPLVSGAVII